MKTLTYTSEEDFKTTKVEFEDTHVELAEGIKDKIIEMFPNDFSKHMLVSNDKTSLLLYAETLERAPGDPVPKGSKYRIRIEPLED